MLMFDNWSQARILRPWELRIPTLLQKTTHGTFVPQENLNAQLTKAASPTLPNVIEIPKTKQSLLQLFRQVDP